MITSKDIVVGDRKIKLSYPDVGTSSAADLEYSKAFTSALEAGLKPQFLMEKTLRDSGLWTLEDDSKLEELNRDLQASLVKIIGTTDAIEREKERVNFYAIQGDLYKLSVKKQSFNNHTAEQKGDEAKIFYLCWNCILKEDGTKLWKSKDELMKEQSVEFVKEVIGQFVSFTNGLEEQVNNIESILDGSLTKETKAKEIEKAEAEVEVVEKVEEAVAAS